MKKLVSCSALATLLGMSSMALAHPGHESVGGFISGISHPFLGLDHLVAMIALGLLASKLGAHAVTFSSFGLGMLGGGLLAFYGVNIPFVEGFIIASLIAVALILFSNRIQSGKAYIVAPVVALFAVCHGWAHVAEQPANLDSAWYMTGMIAGASVLQLAGLGLGRWLRNQAAARKTMGGAAMLTAAASAFSLITG